MLLSVDFICCLRILSMMCVIVRVRVVVESESIRDLMKSCMMMCVCLVLRV